MWGAPGIGKSDIVKQIAETQDGEVVDIRLPLWEPTDIKGIPYYSANDNKMVWAAPAELPTAEEAAKHKWIILFLDEMNSAAPSVQAAAYQLILNRKVGQYELPDNVLIIAAGNREADKGVTYRMPAPLANRFVHLEMAVNFDDWFEWAVANKINKDVVGYLQFAKGDLYDFDPRSSSRSFASPRSWTFVSELIDDEDDDLGLLDGDEDLAAHGLEQGRVWDGLEPAGVDQLKIAVVFMQHIPHAVAGCSGRTVNDSDHFLGEPVEQRAFPDVRASHDGDFRDGHFSEFRIEQMGESRSIPLSPIKNSDTENCATVVAARVPKRDSIENRHRLLHLRHGFRGQSRSRCSSGCKHHRSE